MRSPPPPEPAADASPAVPAAPDLAALALLERRRPRSVPALRPRLSEPRRRERCPPRPAPAPAPGQRGGPGHLTLGPQDAPHRARGAGDPLGRRAIPDGALPGLLADRLAAAGSLPAPAARSPQRRPGAVSPGHDLRPGLGTDRRGREGGCQPARPADRGPPRALSGGRGQVPELARYPATAPALPPDPQGTPGSQRLRPGSR